MGSNAIAGVGTKFRRWTSGNWINIAEIRNIQGPGLSRDMIEVTNLDSVDGWKEFIASFKDGGNVTLTMNFTRAGLDIMSDDFADPNAQNYEILLPDTAKTSLEFKGLVQEYPFDISPDSQIILNVVIRVTGPVLTDSGSGS